MVVPGVGDPVGFQLVWVAGTRIPAKYKELLRASFFSKSQVVNTSGRRVSVTPI